MTSDAKATAAIEAAKRGATLGLSGAAITSRLIDWCVPSHALRWDREYEHVSFCNPHDRKTLGLTVD